MLKLYKCFNRYIDWDRVESIKSPCLQFHDNDFKSIKNPQLLNMYNFNLKLTAGNTWLLHC